MIENKIIEEIFKAPEKWLHLRALAKKLKISPNSVKKYILKLEKKDIRNQKRK